jgi:hypothetical protein
MRQKSGPEKQPAEDAITAPLARCQGQRIKFRSAWVRYRFTCLSQRGQKPAIAGALSKINGLSAKCGACAGHRAAECESAGRLRR